MLLAAWLRLANLGYGEFHGDEARAVLRAAAVIQGHENVLFLHRKGPGEILIPTALFAYTHTINEASARIPFAAANLVALLGVFLLGWRMKGLYTGFAAALLLALDGYLISFARFVQYQSPVLLFSVAAVLVAWRLYQKPVALRAWLVLGALFMGTGLLYHWDMLLAGVPVLALLVLRRISSQTLLRAIWPALLLGLTVVALFYVPFGLHPNAQAALDYVVGSRLEGETGSEGNTLANVFVRTTVYSSVYHIGLIVLLAVGSLAAVYRKIIGMAAAWAIAVTTLLVIAVTWWFGGNVSVAGVNPVFILLALAIVPVWVLRRVPPQDRILWLWFGAPMLAALFLISAPRSHVHIFFVPWALVAGSAAGGLLAQIETRQGRRTLALVAAAASIVVVSVLGYYQYRVHVDTQSETVLHWETARLAGYWSPAAATEIDALYGFPMQNGWKVPGTLYQQGVISGDHADLTWAEYIPQWYLRGQWRCDSTAQWFYAVRSHDPWAESPEAAQDRIRAQGFTRWGDVEVNGQPRMRIYALDADMPKPPLGFDEAAYAAEFDARADAWLPLDYPAVEDSPATRLDATFAGLIRMEGYTYADPAPLHPGDTFRITLYWRALQKIDRSYRVTLQAYDANIRMVAQQDSMPVCDRRDMQRWRPGEGIMDTHKIEIHADAPPGRYPLYLAVYDGETGARLPVLDAAGQPIDDKVQLSELVVE